jgi:hypothetical protein
MYTQDPDCAVMMMCPVSRVNPYFVADLCFSITCFIPYITQAPLSATPWVGAAYLK